MSPYVAKFANNPHSARQTASPDLGDKVRADQIRYSCPICFEAFFFADHAAEHMRVSGHNRMRSFTVRNDA